MDVDKKSELQICKKCGKMIMYSGVGQCLCTSCKKEDDIEFNTVKDYIYENSSATIMEVSKETGVRVARIKSYLRDGRLIIPDNSPMFLNCEICGTNIKYGRLCRECADALSGESKKSMEIEEYQIGEKPNINNGKMRFLNRNN